MADRPKSAEVAELERWFSNASHDEESWLDTGLQSKFAQTAKVLCEYKMRLREQELQMEGKNV